MELQIDTINQDAFYKPHPMDLLSLGCLGDTDIPWKTGMSIRGDADTAASARARLAPARLRSARLGWVRHRSAEFGSVRP